MFDTKISIVAREDLAIWQKLNVVAFLVSGVVGANPALSGALRGRRGQYLQSADDPADRSFSAPTGRR